MKKLQKYDGSAKNMMNCLKLSKNALYTRSDWPGWQKVRIMIKVQNIMNYEKYDKMMKIWSNVIKCDKMTKYDQMAREAFKASDLKA